MMASYMTEIDAYRGVKNEEGKPVMTKLYMDVVLRQNLDLIKDKVKQDWDFLLLIDGIEGGGKSVFAQQIAKYCDPTLNLDRICFTPDEFKQAIVKAEKFQAIIYDEAYGGLNSRQAMTMTNRTIISMLAEIRQKCLFCFIVVPSFFDLDKNVALWRSRGLFHIELGKNYERGYFKFYNSITKKYLFGKGKKFYDYRCVWPNFKGRFHKGYVVDEAAYRLKKLKSLEKYTESEELNKVAKELRREIIGNLYDLKDKLNINKKELAMIVSVSENTIARYVKESKEKGSYLRQKMAEKDPPGSDLNPIISHNIDYVSQNEPDVEWGEEEVEEVGADSSKEYDQLEDDPLAPRDPASTDTDTGNPGKTNRKGKEEQ